MILPEILRKLNSKQATAAYWFEITSTKTWTVKTYAHAVRALYLPCEFGDGVARRARRALQKEARRRMNDAARHFVIGCGLLLARKGVA